MHSKGIVYGDLKTENILINKNGIVKLCDFNLSGTYQILEDQFQGTMVYMAPELISGENKSKMSDFWALGVLSYLITYKKYPYLKKTKNQLFYNILNGNIQPETNWRAPNNLKSFIFDLMN